MGHESRKSLAEEFGIPTDTLGSYERGIAVPNTTMLTAYHERFGVNLSWLIAGSGVMFDDPGKRPKQHVTLEKGLMKKLARLVIRVYRDAGVKLPPEEITSEATELFNELAGRVADITDANEVDAVFPQLDYLLKKRLSENDTEASSSKHSA